MAKNQNTFEKRRREVEKKFKADEKRKNRQKKKLPDSNERSPVLPPEKTSDDDVQ